ncbi:MAG: hypothetical protein ACK4NY_18025 [Spirosomataceae bacterium]
MVKNVETALIECRQTKPAYQVLKKEIEKQKNLLFGVKFEKIPRIGLVENDYAFEILLRTHTYKLHFCLINYDKN